MADLLAQVENDQRFVATMNALHASPDPFSPSKLPEPIKENKDEDPQKTPPRNKPVLVKSTPNTILSGSLVPTPSDRLVTRPSGSLVPTPSGSLVPTPSDRLVTRPSGNNLPTPDDYKTLPLDVANLAKNQVRVLSFLLEMPINRTSYNEISKQTDVGRDSVIAAIESLVKKGFLQKMVLKNAEFQGFSFVLNKSLCDHFLTVKDLYQYRTPPQQTLSHSFNQPSGNDYTRPLGSLGTTPSGNQTTKLPDGVVVHSSSSSLKTTTTKETPDGLVNTPAGEDNFILTGPEMAYWESLGLQERQTRIWCSEFSITAAELRQQLAWARWDLVSNGKEKEVKKGAISWVYGFFKRTGGCYPRPDNYQSPVEIRAAQMRIQQEKEEQARQEMEKMELENAFKIVWSNPDGEEYQAIWSSLSRMEKEFEKGSNILEKLMKAKYLELHAQDPPQG